jgi:hypothetical protein
MPIQWLVNFRFALAATCGMWQPTQEREAVGVVCAAFG